jgi:MFS family permease
MHRFTSIFEVAKGNKNWQLYFFSQIFALLGGTVQLVVVSWLAYEVTKSEIILGFVAALQYLPLLLFGLFAGHFLDKFSKYKALRSLQVFQAAWPLAIAAWMFLDGVNIYNLVVAASMFGLLKVFDSPLRHSFLSYIVAKEDVKQAYSLYASASQIARVSGPIVGGLMLAWVSPVWCFILMGLSYVFVAYLYNQMNTEKFFIHKDTKNHESKVRESLEYVWQHKTIRDLVFVGAYVAIFFWSYNAYLPIMVKTMITNSFGAMSFSLLITAYAAGSLVGNFYSASHKDLSYGHLRKILIAYAVFGIIFSFVPNFYLSFLIMFICGIFIAQINAITNALVRVNSEDKYLGTMMSVWLVVTVGLTTFGSIYYGYMAEYFGIQIALLVPPVIFLFFAIFKFRGD